MEHIVQFGINLDDEAIARSIVSRATEEVRKALKNLRGEGYYGRDEVKRIVETEAETQIRLFIKEHSGEIISQAVKEVSSSMTRTKAFKEAMGDMASELMNRRDKNE